MNLDGASQTPRPAPTRLLYAYFLRVQILSSLFLIIFPLAAMRSSATPLLHGMFDINYGVAWRDALAMFLVAFVAWALAGTSATTAWTTLANAHERFEVARVRGLPPTLPRWACVAAGVPAWATIGAAIWHSRSASSVSLVPLLVGAAAGSIASYLLLDYTRVWFATPGEAGWLFRWLAEHPKLRSGYVDANGNPRPGHRIATHLFLTTMIVYGGVGLLKWARIGYAPVPTVALVMLLGLPLCWFASGAAFFFDRYRVPVLAPLLALPLVMSFAPWSDHYYRTEPHPPSDSPTAAQLLQLIDGPVIVVASDGGGIQAAAWNAQVLAGLAIQLRAERGDDRFASSVRMISSVSGGGVGAMYFASHYRDGVLAGNRASIVDNAQASSLNDVAWGAAFPDFLRTFAPVFWADRGQALEWAWKRDGGVSERLAEWRKDVWALKRPANIFNATIVDSGQRLLIGTTLVSGGTGQRNFEQLYPDTDIEVVTAARLSAAFTYVTPAARSDLPNSVRDNALHIVDGGYYDNYGMATLTQWLHEALDGTYQRPKRVLVIQIRSAPPQDETAADHWHGWFYQAWAPLEAMLNVRTTGQLSHNEVEFERLQQLWAEQNVVIDNAVFQFCGDKGHRPPLSWHLTALERDTIRREWTREIEHPSGLAVVRQFLKDEPTPSPPPAKRCS